MKICGFGHREIFSQMQNVEGILQTKEYLSTVLEYLIVAFDANIFMTGGRGEFDNMFCEVIRNLKSKYPYIKLVLVEPYFSNSLNLYKDYYEALYDSIIVPDEIAGAHYKQAITLRNQWIIDNCDFVITYISKKYGGAYKAMKYAEKNKKLVLNMADI